MSAASNYLENELLDHALGTGAFTSPTNVYLALFTASTGLETNAPTGECQTPGSGGYSRQTIEFDAASGGSAANTNTETFSAATTSWGSITHVAIVDHASNTNYGTDVNVLFWGAVTTAKTIDTGDTFQVSAGNLTISLD